MNNETPYTIAKSTQPLERYNTVKHLTGRFHNSESFWRKLLQRGSIPYVKVGANVLVPESALQAWLEARTVKKGGQ